MHAYIIIYIYTYIYITHMFLHISYHPFRSDCKPGRCLMLFDGQSLVELVESLVWDWRMFLSNVIHGGMFRHLINSKWRYSRYNRYNLASKPLGGIVWYFELLQVPSAFFRLIYRTVAHFEPHIISRVSARMVKYSKNIAKLCPNMPQHVPWHHCHYWNHIPHETFCFCFLQWWHAWEFLSFRFAFQVWYSLPAAASNDAE